MIQVVGAIKDHEVLPLEGNKVPERFVVNMLNLMLDTEIPNQGMRNSRSIREIKSGLFSFLYAYNCLFILLKDK